MSAAACNDVHARPSGHQANLGENLAPDPSVLYGGDPRFRRAWAKSMPVDDDMIPDAVLEKASAWAFRLQSLPDDAELQTALAAWLAESDVHVRAWALTQKAWQLTGQARPVSGRGAAPRRQDGANVSRRRPTRRRIVATTLAIAACMLLVLALPAIQVHLSADHSTAVAETRRVILDDGSIVELGADSAIAIAFGPAGRRITLLQGEAFFEVVPDPKRPFSVHSGDLAATVTGTAFDVALTDRSFAVTVASGSVRVGSVEAPAEAVDLNPGEGAVIARTSHRLTHVALPSRSVAAWRHGRLIVEDAPLMDVVATLGRYQPGRIVVASASLREKRVTGVYNLDDPVGALRILAAPYDGNVLELTPYLTVLSAD